MIAPMGYVIRRIDPLTQEALEALGKVLRDLRGERGISQAVLADRAGVHQSTISRLECGKAPGFKVLALARILAGLERGEEYARTVWLEPAPPGWQQLMTAFSTKGQFAARIKARRVETALKLEELMQPQASRTKYEVRPRARRRRERPPAKA